MVERASTGAAKAISQLRALENQPSAELAEFLQDLLKEAYKKHSDTGASVWGIRSAEGVARTNSGVLVNSKDLVMKVVLDTNQNYSVKGYNERASDCFGKIYLGLDKGAEYDRQSGKVNAAIQGITAADAFTLALQETRKVLASDPAASDDDVSVKVLAASCRSWFDLPDGINVKEGGLRTDFKTPSRCPGDYNFPSAYIFFPDPTGFPTKFGPPFGFMLKQSVDAFVAGLRASRKLPTGVLSRAVFEAFPSGEDDLIARTITGVMMGMIPTVYFNLANAVGAWRAGDGKTFAALQNALKNHGGSDPYIRASEVLEQPLIQAMQGNPMPPAVWRTAVRAHTLGTKNPVQVAPDDKMHISIVSATTEDLQAGITDVFPIFGGNRNATPHPTHACPGYHAAMGIMLGYINGLMEPT